MKEWELDNEKRTRGYVISVVPSELTSTTLISGGKLFAAFVNSCFIFFLFLLRAAELLNFTLLCNVSTCNRL